MYDLRARLGWAVFQYVMKMKFELNLRKKKLFHYTFLLQVVFEVELLYCVIVFYVYDVMDYELFYALSKKTGGLKFEPLSAAAAAVPACI